jgi:ABC-type multidrug transport system fused ATPase/permease subunit
LIDATVVFPNGKVALSDINLTISRGERIGVVGGSGSGKSTLAKVLLGLIPLSKGRYLIDDIAVDELNHEQIARYISIVLQDSEIFNTSLKENISGFEEIPSDVVTDSARIAELLTAIDKLPEGFATRLGEKGYRLSGGERQRVALARAICQDSDILILDEATSSLDTFTETQIHRNIANSLAGKTIVVIAHRLSTVRDVDRIIVLNQGQIVESGAPDQLLADKQSYFSTLWNYQMSQTES